MTLHAAVDSADKSAPTPKNRAHTIDMKQPIPVGLALASALRQMPEPGRSKLAPVAKALEARR